MRAKQFIRRVNEGMGDSDEANAVVAEVIKLIGEGHTEVSPDVITTKVSAALGHPFMLKDLVAVNHASPELQHYIDSINPSKIKFSTDILTVKNEDPAKAKEKSEAGVANMAARAASRSRLGESELDEFAENPRGDDEGGKVSLIVQIVDNLLKAGNTVDSYVLGARGHVERADLTTDGFTPNGSLQIRKIGTKPSKQGARGIRPFKASDDDNYEILMVGPKHYKIVDKMEDRTDEGWGAEPANARHAEQQSDWDKTLEKHKDDPKMTSRLKHLRSWKASEAEKAAHAGEYVVRGRGHKFPGEDLDEATSTVKYGVFAKGGSVGSDNSKPYRVFDTKEEAIACAKRYRSQLTPGERDYYKMNFVTKAIKESIESADPVEGQLNESVEAIRKLSGLK